MTNLEIRDFRNGLAKYINSVDLPVEIKSMVLSEMARQAEQIANAEIQKELQQKEVSDNGKNL